MPVSKCHMTRVPMILEKITNIMIKIYSYLKIKNYTVIISLTKSPWQNKDKTLTFLDYSPRL